jgi:hypothetical protein
VAVAPAVLVVTTVAPAAMTAVARVRVDVVPVDPAVPALADQEALLACAAAQALPAVIAAPVATARPAMTSVVARENLAAMAKDHHAVVAAAMTGAMTAEAPVSAVLMIVPLSSRPPAAGWRPFCLNPQASKTSPFRSNQPAAPIKSLIWPACSSANPNASASAWNPCAVNGWTH